MRRRHADTQIRRYAPRGRMGAERREGWMAGISALRPLAEMPIARTSAPARGWGGGIRHRAAVVGRSDRTATAGSHRHGRPSSALPRSPNTQEDSSGQPEILRHRGVHDQFRGHALCRIEAQIEDPRMRPAGASSSTRSISRSRRGGRPERGSATGPRTRNPGRLPSRGFPVDARGSGSRPRERSMAAGQILGMPTSYDLAPLRHRPGTAITRRIRIPHRDHLRIAPGSSGVRRRRPAELTAAPAPDHAR
jgi:hypothetical protein